MRTKAKAVSATAGTRAERDREDQGEHQAAEGAEGGPALEREALALVPLAAEALDGEDVGEALLDPAGRGRAGLAAAERLRAHARAEDERREQRERQEAERRPGDARARARGVVHRPDGHEQAEHGGDGRDEQPVADLRDRRRVVHQAIHGIADALVVERAHGKRLDPLEDARAVEMVQRLREPQREAELEEAEQAAGEAVAEVGFVLGGGGGVAPGGERALRAVDLGGGRADRADREHQQRLRREQPEQDLERARVAQRREQRAARSRGSPRSAARDRILIDHVVDDQLHGPGQQQARREAQRA